MAGRLDMSDLIAKLRRSTPARTFFADRVAGVADENRVAEYANMEPPCAYVAYIGDSAAPSDAINENVQWVTETWAILVKLAAHEEIRGQAPAMTIPAIRRAIFKAIFNWSPTTGYTLFSYGGSSCIGISRDVTIWRFTFMTRTQIDECDGETEEQFDPLPAFKGINAIVDAIDPHDPGLPPSEEYQEYAASRAGPPPWATGPEGRIEARFTLDNLDTIPPPPAPGQLPRKPEDKPK
jgi:hypothetical protein